MITEFNNRDAIEMFESLSQKDLPFCSEKLTANGDHSEIDVLFISKYLNRDSVWLDIGSGSGAIINKINPNDIKKLICVEPIENYAKKIKKAENVEVITATFDDFITQNHFDLITAFGVMHYFNSTEAYNVYRHLGSIAKDKCYLIIKNQFAVKNKVIINNFSNELKMHYFAEYRTVEEEKTMLREAGFDFVDLIDIYPNTANRFSNTHFFALVTKFNSTCREKDMI
jgi:16S rRNA G527 N7-methylase RsmG